MENSKLVTLITCNSKFHFRGKSLCIYFKQHRSGLLRLAEQRHVWLTHPVMGDKTERCRQGSKLT